MEQELRLRLETIKLLEENVQEPLQDTGVDIGFLDKTSKAQTTNVQIDKLDHTKLRSFYTQIIIIIINR